MSGLARALWQRIAGSDATVIRGNGVYLRAPRLGDYPAWARLRAQSRQFLEPWEPTWPADHLERAAFRRRLWRDNQERREGLGYSFLLFRPQDDVLLGGLSLSYVRRGVSQVCLIGYWMGAPYAGQGHMTKAVRAVLPFVFDTLHLHRLEAACLPNNLASIRLLEKVGFQREGYGRRCVWIAGEWRDHLLYAMLADDPRL